MYFFLCIFFYGKTFFRRLNADPTDGARWVLVRTPLPRSRPRVRGVLLGFVRCTDFSRTTYQDDFYLNQSSSSGLGSRTSALSFALEETLDFARERTRHSNITRILNVMFLYKVRHFDASDLEAIMDSLALESK